jgi:hypothetical protein
MRLYAVHSCGRQGYGYSWPVVTTLHGYTGYIHGNCLCSQTTVRLVELRRRRTGQTTVLRLFCNIALFCTAVDVVTGPLQSRIRTCSVRFHQRFYKLSIIVIITLRQLSLTIRILLIPADTCHQQPGSRPLLEREKIVAIHADLGDE